MSNAEEVQLLNAAAEGQTAVVQKLLSQRVEKNCVNNENLTPLMLAAWKGHLETVVALLNANAALEKKETLGSTALMGAAWNGHVEVVRELLKAGAQPNELRHHDGRGALMGAASRNHIDVVLELVDAGADLNLKRADGWTALISATFSGNTDVVKVLVSNGASVDEKDNAGKTALDWAKEEYHYEIISLLSSPSKIQELVEQGKKTVESGDSSNTKLVEELEALHAELAASEDAKEKVLPFIESKAAVFEAAYNQVKSDLVASTLELNKQEVSVKRVRNELEESSSLIKKLEQELAAAKQKKLELRSKLLSANNLLEKKRAEFSKLAQTFVDSQSVVKKVNQLVASIKQKHFSWSQSVAEGNLGSWQNPELYFLLKDVGLERFFEGLKSSGTSAEKLSSSSVSDLLKISFPNGAQLKYGEAKLLQLSAQEVVAKKELPKVSHDATLNVSLAKAWTVENVASYFVSTGSTDVASVLRNNQISGSTLVNFKAEELSLLQIPDGAKNAPVEQKVKEFLAKYGSGSSSSDGGSSLETSAPSTFVCGISSKLLDEPVIAFDGFAYEKNAIEQYFAKGGELSPFTGDKFEDKGLVEYELLHDYISKWKDTQQ